MSRTVGYRIRVSFPVTSAGPADPAVLLDAGPPARRREAGRTGVTCGVPPGATRTGALGGRSTTVKGRGTGPGHRLGTGSAGITRRGPEGNRTKVAIRRLVHEHVVFECHPGEGP